jgi:hypothetical protein
MTSSHKIVIGVGLGLLCGVILKSGLIHNDNVAWHLADPSTAPATVAQTSTIPAQNTVQPVSAPIVAQGPKLASISEPPQSGPDGKEVIPPDGKEVIPPDGKETLPPVGELLPSGRPAEVNQSNGAPPVEFLNKNNNHTDPLLDPPNPQNVGGPVVSPETR